MIGHSRLLVAAAAAAALSAPAAAQGLANVEQVAPAAPSNSITVAPVRGSRSSAAGVETAREAPAPSVPPEIVEACRRAMAEDRPAPDGIDCMAVAQALAQAAPEASAEGSLLGLLGQSANVTGEPSNRARTSIDADAVARQLSAGDVQPGSGAAGAIARDRAPPSSGSPR